MQDKPFEPATLNFYAYVANNPAVLTDPAGTDWEDDVKAAVDAARKKAEDEIKERRIKETAKALKDLLEQLGIRITIERAIQSVKGALSTGRSLVSPDLIQGTMMGGVMILTLEGVTATLTLAIAPTAQTVRHLAFTAPLATLGTGMMAGAVFLNEKIYQGTVNVFGGFQRFLEMLGRRPW